VTQVHTKSGTGWGPHRGALGDCTVAGSWASCHRKSNVDRCTNFSWAADWGMASVLASCAMCNLCQRSRAAAPLPCTARLHTPGCFNYGISYPLASGELSYLHMCVTHCAMPSIPDLWWVKLLPLFTVWKVQSPDKM
jgi:hypothetical protein